MHCSQFAANAIALLLSHSVLSFLPSPLLLPSLLLLLPPYPSPSPSSLTLSFAFLPTPLPSPPLPSPSPLCSPSSLLPLPSLAPIPSAPPPLRLSLPLLSPFFPSRYLWFPPKRRLLTMEEYKRQGEEETAKALVALREHCQSPASTPWRLMARLRTPKRLGDRFDADTCWHWKIGLWCIL